MPSPECQPGPSFLSQKEYGFICMTVDDLSYTPTETEKSRDAAQIVATGRRSWKTLKGKSEAVWPPVLEACLIEALIEYSSFTPGGKNPINGRFPMRNRFCSDYIYRNTKRTRTPKQVGSRLQQLRDTCKKQEILDLILRKNHPESSSTGSPSAADSQSDFSPEESPSPSPEHTSCTSTKSLVVTIVLQKELWPTSTPCLNFLKEDPTAPLSIQLAPRTSSPTRGFFQDSTILPFLSGTVEFIFPYALNPRASFVVFAGDPSQPVHVEQSDMHCSSSPTGQSAYRYSVDLVPAFWGTICSSHNVNQYTIVQTLHPAFPSQPSARAVSIVYKFSNIPQSTTDYSNSTRCFLKSSPSNESIAMPIPINPPVNSNLVCAQWMPSQSDYREFSSSPDQDQGYQVEPSYRMISASGSPAVPTFPSPLQRCDTLDSTSRALLQKYQHGDVASQMYPGTYYQTNANYSFHVDAHQQPYPLHHYSNC